MNEIFKYTKECTVCKQEKLLSEFVTFKGKAMAICYACNNFKAKENYKKSAMCTRKGSPWYNISRLQLRKKLESREEEHEF